LGEKIEVVGLWVRTLMSVEVTVYRWWAVPTLLLITQGEIAVALWERKLGNSGCFFWKRRDRLGMNGHNSDAPDLNRGYI
jgi:hypothetical protein